MSNNDNGTISERLNRLLKRNYKKAILLMMPSSIGGPLSEIFFGNELQDFISRLNEESESRQKEIIEMLETLIDLKTDDLYPIITIGSANAETIFKCEEDVILGTKHNSELENLYGGSGVNFAMRLLSAGRLAIPILPIGNDEVGRSILEAIRNAVETIKIPGPIINFLNNSRFFNSNIKTPTSGILISGSKRTIFKQNLEGAEYFHEHLLMQLDDIEKVFNNKLGPIMIGHIQSDSVNGISTKEIINRYRNRYLIYTVFGNSQIKHGLQFWEKEGVFKNISIFQLNMDEAKRFFVTENRSMTSEEILEWCRERELTAVLTLDKFGAIGTFRNLESLYVAYPLISENEVVDSTGAGDAFAAGMVSYLADKREFDDADFNKAMQRGRIWASCACKYVGGTGKQPAQELKQFKKDNPGYDKKALEVKEIRHAQELLKFIDLIYQ